MVSCPVPAIVTEGVLPRRVPVPHEFVSLAVDLANAIGFVSHLCGQTAAAKVEMGTCEGDDVALLEWLQTAGG